MKIRCKFQAHKVAKTAWGQEEISLTAVHGSDGENASFAKATPSGHMTITVDNPEVIGVFQPGAYYYIDITTATE